MHFSQHNKMTSAFNRRRRALQSLHDKHQANAATYGPDCDQSKRMAKRYADELRKMGA